MLLEAALDELARRRPGEDLHLRTRRMMAAVAQICEDARRALRGLAGDADGVRLRRLPRLPGPRSAAGGFLYACTEGPCVDAAAIDWTRGSLVDERRRSRGRRRLA